MAKIVINADRCKGCELCVYYCPKGEIRLSEGFNRKGLHPCVFQDHGTCKGCCICAIICPDVAIEVYK